MEPTNWLRQTDGPLFPDVLWARPENKRQAGKLLIIGGHSQSFSAVSKAYAAAQKAGAGTIRVILPLSLQKTLGRAFPEAEFADSTSIGSFSRQALGLFLELSDWADGVLLAGEFGRNSETAILLENYVDRYSGQLTLAGDSLDYFFNQTDFVIKRPKTTLVGALGQMQRLSKTTAIKQSADLAQTVNTLITWTSDIKANVVTAHSEQIIVGCLGKCSTTKAKAREVNEETAAYTSVWTLQQPGKIFQVLSTAIFCLVE